MLCLILRFNNWLGSQIGLPSQLSLVVKVIQAFRST
jgi:hypothetical protein